MYILFVYIGNFNWRFIFDFEYLPNENRIVYRRKEFSLATLNVVEVEYQKEPTSIYA